jgi:hypothetical protein
MGRVKPAMVDKTQGRGRPNLMRQDGSALEGLWAGASDAKGKKNRQGWLTVRQTKIRRIINRIYYINWWRRRESNPRPPIVPGSFYMLSRRFSFAPEDFHWQNS